MRMNQARMREVSRYSRLTCLSDDNFVYIYPGGLTRPHMVGGAIARRLKGEAHVSALRIGSVQCQVFDEVAFLKDVRIGVCQLADFGEGLVILGDFHSHPSGFVCAHAIVGEASCAALADVGGLLQVYGEGEIFAQIAGVPLKVCLLQAAPQSVHYDGCCFRACSQGFGGCQVPCQGQGECFAHLSVAGEGGGLEGHVFVNLQFSFVQSGGGGGRISVCGVAYFHIRAFALQGNFQCAVCGGQYRVLDVEH